MTFKGAVQRGSVLKEFRRKQGLSQRELAERSGISRGRLRRLEEETFDRVTQRELRALSEALGVEMGTLTHKEQAFTKGPFLGRAGEIRFELKEVRQGYRFASLTAPRKDFFWGKLFLAGKKSLGPAQAPRAASVLIQTLLGRFLIEVAGERYEIQEGDHLLFAGQAGYTIENLLNRESVGLVLMVPAPAVFAA